MRLLFAGTPAVALPSLDALLASRHEVVAVLTRPDARAGRGRTLTPSPVKERALEAGLEVLTPTTLKDPEVQARIAAIAPDAAPVVAYGNLVPPAVLGLPRHGWVNLHFSVLPAWRGAAPVQHAIIAGDEVTGASTFLLEAGLDTGPVLGTLTETIRPLDTSGDLLGRLAAAGSDLLVKTLDALEEGILTPVPQPADGVSLAPRLTTEDARVRWQHPAMAVDRRVRGCTPAPGAWTMFGDKAIKIFDAKPMPARDPKGIAGKLGEIVAVEDDGITVVCADGRFKVTRVQADAGKVGAADWAKGAGIEKGAKFG